MRTATTVGRPTRDRACEPPEWIAVFRRHALVVAAALLPPVLVACGSEPAGVAAVGSETREPAHAEGSVAPPSEGRPDPERPQEPLEPLEQNDEDVTVETLVEPPVAARPTTVAVVGDSLTRSAEEEILAENPLAGYHEEWSWQFITTERMTRTLVRDLTAD